MLLAKEIISLERVHRLINFSPLILVSASFENQRTIAPIAWYCPLSQKPPLVGVAIGQSHLTHLLISRSQEFAINIPSVELLSSVVYCGSTSGEKEDKFKGANLTVQKAQIIQAPLIAECFANLECKVVDKVAVSDHTFFVGLVVSAQIQKDYLKKEFVVDIKKAQPIHHLGGEFFALLQKEIKNS